MLIRYSIGALVQQDTEAALALYDSLPPSDDRNYTLRNLASQWAETDSTKALAWARSLDGRARETALESMMSRIISSNPSQAARLVEESPQSSMARTHARTVAQQLAEKNWDEARAWVNKLPAGDARENALRGLFVKLAETDPANAVKQASAMGNNYNTRYTIQEIVGQWLRKDFAGASAYVTTNATNSGNGDLAQLVARSAVQRDMAAAQKWTLALPPGEARSMAAHAIVDTLSTKDPGAAMDFTGNLTASEQSNLLTDELILKLVRYDVEKSAKWAEQLPESRVRQRVFARLAETMLQTDPARAAKYAEQAPWDDSSYSNPRQNVATRWAEVDPAAAAKWTVSQFPTNRMSRFSSPLYSVMHTWASRAPVDAAHFATNLPPTERRNILSTVATEWARVAPSDALAFMRALPAAENQSALHNIVSEWASADPQAAAAWVKTNFVETKSRSSGFVNALILRWAAKDPDAAIEWTRAQPPGAMRDQAFSELASTLSSKQPALAAAMADSIVDATKHNYSIENVARRWLNEQPAAAKAWLQTNALPQPRKERLLKNPNGSF